MGHFTDYTPHLESSTEQMFSFNRHLNAVTGLAANGSPLSHGFLWGKCFAVSLGEIFKPTRLVFFNQLNCAAVLHLDYFFSIPDPQEPALDDYLHL